eukprot:gene14125-18702_t
MTSDTIEDDVRGRILVTAGELALTLAVFAAQGARPGDRIEHGGMIPREAIEALRSMGLTVVTQSAFVGERGDRYLSAVDSEPWIRRCIGGIGTACRRDARR